MSELHRWLVESLHKLPEMWKAFSCRGFIMNHGNRFRDTDPRWWISSFRCRAGWNANAPELLQSCTKPSICDHGHFYCILQGKMCVCVWRKVIVFVFCIFVFIFAVQGIPTNLSWNKILEVSPKPNCAQKTIMGCKQSNNIGWNSPTLRHVNKH